MVANDGAVAGPSEQAPYLRRHKTARGSGDGHFIVAAPPLADGDAVATASADADAVTHFCGDGIDGAASTADVIIAVFIIAAICNAGMPLPPPARHFHCAARDGVTVHIHCIYRATASATQRHSMYMVGCTRSL